MGEKSLRFDLLIAVFALVLSGVASIASVYQAHVISEQFSATVWPYLTFSVTSSESTFSLSVANDGLGPALIRSAWITLDGKPQSSWRSAVLAMLTPLPATRGKTATGTYRSISPGEVIRAGVTDEPISLHGFPGLAAALQGAAVRRGASISICYCSLLGRCWMKVWKPLQDDEPYDVRACPAPRTILPS